MSEIDVFTGMMSCIKNFFVWHYDTELHLIDTSCPEPEYWDAVLCHDTVGEQVLRHCRKECMPVLVSSRLHLLWIAVPRRNKTGLKDIYLLGPIFFSVQAETFIRQTVTRTDIPVRFRKELSARLRDLPVISQTSFLQFGTMLYFCLSGNRISSSDIAVIPAMSEQDLNNSSFSGDVIYRNHSSEEMLHGGGAYETLLLQLIEEGNLNFKKVLASASFSHGIVGEMAVGNSLRQAKNEVITAATLFSRAAIRGGLSRDLALTLSDYYIQSVESARSIPETFQIMQTMQEDYIRRVNRCRKGGSFSAPVRTCMDLIDRSIESPLTIAEIAEKTGYSGYYVSSMFRKETGSGISEYIQKKKVERAKLLLKTSDRSVGDIAAALSYSTPSRFSHVFHKVTGMTPREYRNSPDPSNGSQ